MEIKPLKRKNPSRAENEDDFEPQPEPTEEKEKKSEEFFFEFGGMKINLTSLSISVDKLKIIAQEFLVWFDERKSNKKIGGDFYG